MKNFLSLALLCASVTYAQAENTLSFSTPIVDIAPGASVSVNVVLSIDEPITSVGFDLVLSGELNCTNAARLDVSKEMDDDENYYFEFVKNNGVTYYYVLVKSDDLNTIDTGEHQIAKLTLTSTNGYNGALCIVNASASRTDGTNIDIKYPTAVIGTNGYSSYSTKQNVLIEGATANYGVIDGSIISLVEATDNKVEHDQGVVLTGTEGDIVYATSIDSAEHPTTNNLAPSVRNTVVSAGDVHVLATKDGTTGFYLYNGTTIGAGKAYLEGASGARISFENEAGIENVELNNVEAIFNLQGQKMDEAKKGINIVNGKKVMY